MLVATILTIMLYFGGGNGPFGELMIQYIKGPIKATITEVDRRDMALKELGSLDDAIKVLNDNVLKDIKQLDKLVKKYDSKPEDFDSLFSAALTGNEKDLNDIWNRRSAMLTHIHADEWQTIISSAKATAENKAKKK